MTLKIGDTVRLSTEANAAHPCKWLFEDGIGEVTYIGTYGRECVEFGQDEIGVVWDRDEDRCPLSYLPSDLQAA